MKTLQQIYENHQYHDGWGDKGTAHTYIPEYERLLKPYRKSGSILEIGIMKGHSIRMWREYFESGDVYGADIHLQPEATDLLTMSGVSILQCDATNNSLTEQLENKTFDVILDDGSHLIDHQVSSFNLLKSRVNKNGIYLIEDVSDIDSSKDLLMSLHTNCTIIDNRHINNRWDDVIVFYKF
jgi:hypothetical protein